MHLVALVSDLAMGSILGLFLHAVVARTWPSLAHPVVIVLLYALAVGVVLYRRPTGRAVEDRANRAPR